MFLVAPARRPIRAAAAAEKGGLVRRRLRTRRRLGVEFEHRGSKRRSLARGRVARRAPVGWGAIRRAGAVNSAVSPVGRGLRLEVGVGGAVHLGPGHVPAAEVARLAEPT